MLNYIKRKNRVFVLTIDPALAADVDDRIRLDPRLIGTEVVLPCEGRVSMTAADVMALTKQTISGRLIIFDVRSQTLPRLQEPFNRAVGFNRADLNERCFTLCIGDGPMRLFEPGSSPNMFAGLLAQCRIDYSAAAFFYDPFIHYMPDERPLMGVDRDNKLPTMLPKRLAEGFKEKNLEVRQIRAFFRAAGASLDEKGDLKRKRHRKLKALLRKRIETAFGDRVKMAGNLLSMKGYTTADEVLPVHTYPCHFEHWAYDLLEKARVELEKGKGGS